MTVILLLDQNDMNKFKEYCDGLDNDQIEYCYGNAAVRLVQIDPVNSALAARVCAVAPENGNQCYSDMIRFGATSFRDRSSELRSYCKVLPPDWYKKCFMGDFRI